MKNFDKRLFLVLMIIMGGVQMTQQQQQQEFYSDNDNIPLENFNINAPIKVQEGQEVRLRCGFKAKDSAYMENSEVTWLYKACGESDFNRTSCNDKKSLPSEWTKLNCDNKPCKPTLTLKNSTVTDSGLYLCKIYPFRTPKSTYQIQLIKTYQVDVLRDFKDFIEIDLSDKNLTVYERSQIVLQCRIGYISNRPTIKWFRKRKLTETVTDLDDNAGFTESSIKIGHFNQVNTYISDYFKYFENNYELIESAGEKEISDDTFLSKLIIGNASKAEHEGIYVCLGINYDGFKFKEVTVNILQQEDSNSRPKKNLNFNQVLFILIILVLLAVIPICLYTCYLLACRKISQNKLKRANLNIYKVNSYYQITEIMQEQERNFLRSQNTFNFIRN